MSVEDKLRRSMLLRSDRQAMLSKSKAHLIRLGEQERTLRSSLDLKAARLRELELFNDPISREEVKPVAAEVSRVNAEVESILFKKGLEDSAIRMYVTAIAGCEDIAPFPSLLFFIPFSLIFDSRCILLNTFSLTAMPYSFFLIYL